VLEFYSGATGPSGRFTEGFSLRRLQVCVRTVVGQVAVRIVAERRAVEGGFENAGRIG